MRQAGELVKTIQKGLLQWYTFTTGSSALYTGSEADAFTDLLAECGLDVTYVNCSQTYAADWLQEHRGSFDYVISISALETQPNPQMTLSAWRLLLKPDGVLLLGMNNRLGLRYFCGDHDPYTGRSFDGIENYHRAYANKEDAFQGRMYDQAELRRMLQTAGFSTAQFYSVLPDLGNPALLYAEDYLPNEDLAIRLFPTYHNPDSVFLEEEYLYSDLIANGLFHQMANAYLIECAPQEKFSDVQHVTNSTERGQENAFMTIIRRSGVVEKRAIYPEGQTRLKELLEHNRDLSAHGIEVVDAKLEDGVYVMPFVGEEVGQVYLTYLSRTDRERFLMELDHFRDLILRSSDIVKPDIGDGEGAILRRGYIDLIPLNSFHQDGTFVFYDQEFCLNNCPSNVIVYRVIASCYAGNRELEAIIPIKSLLERYGLTANLQRWQKMERAFLADLRKEKELLIYHERHRRSIEQVHMNRQRINYSEENYQHLFVDIFRNLDNRKLILFGSGVFAKKFLGMYRRDYPVYAVIDNNQEQWGQELEGIPIRPPGLLRQLQSGEYKVLICIRNYMSVIKQLEALGVTEYSVFDPYRDYPRKEKPALQLGKPVKNLPKKKYHVGYIAGVFDLFHLGHLNMFKRAKEQCDHLIVGVVTDEGVRKFKETEPFVPFEERIEMVRSCRYVDEAVEIPLNCGGTEDAYHLYHFDCQFSGSDYIDDPSWLAEKIFLEKHGAEMVFFPYTESTSSTKLKSLIDARLL